MSDNWHTAFNPQRFLSRIDLDKLISQNALWPGNEGIKLSTPCVRCSGLTSPGIVLNDNTYLCKECFEWISKVEYPEIYESKKREYIRAQAARNLARKTFIAESSSLKIGKIAWTVALFSIPAFLLNPYFIGLTTALFVLSLRLTSHHTAKLQEWDQIYPDPKAPVLRHFHDSSAQLTDQDIATLHVFNHWPGYPPFWQYLRQLTLSKDRDRCQVSGCPSRLSLHVHHINPVSQGGAHSPENLVTLCEFHHALEPDRGHERIWGSIKTAFFTMVRAHFRSSQTGGGKHPVRAHLRRLQLVSSDELELISEYHGLACRKCGITHLTFHSAPNDRQMRALCESCGHEVMGLRQLTEETGPHMAEFLGVTRNKGRWKARWDMLEQRKGAVWCNRDGSKRPPKRTVKPVDRNKSQAEKRPFCPRCGSPMKNVRARPSDTWSSFWGCTEYRATGCKGSMRIRS